MANKKLDQLVNLSTLTDSDLLLVYDVDGGSQKTKNMTYAQFHTLISGTVGGGGGGISEVVEDTSPQLGGDLDVNSNSIVGGNFGAGSGNGGNILMYGGKGGTTGGDGGYFWSQGNQAISGNGNGGAWYAYGGEAAGSGDGGQMLLKSGSGGYSGGEDGNGGALTITGGPGGAAGGDGASITLTGGLAKAGDGAGGDIILTPGAGDGSGSTGAINITQTTAPTVTTDKLYNEGGALTWNGTDLTASGGGGSGLFTEDADQNIVGGSGAGAALVGSSALNNFLGGNSAGALITEGDANIAIGTDSLDANLTGSNNVAIGQDALGTAITSSNIGIGTQAGRNIGGAGANSIAIGHGALGDPQGGSTGTNNIVMGTLAMTSGVMGSAEWNFIVHATTTAMTNADSNIIIGELAAELITSGSRNVFLGEGAGAAVTTGSSNIAIGPDALENVSGSASTGSNNIAIGRDSLSAVGITSANKNIAIGRATGALITTANNNIMIGEETGAKLTTGAYNLIIGAQAGPTTNTSNKLFINQAESDTPLIGGDFSTGAVELSGSVRLTERADHIGTPAATFGELWVRSDSPNALIFTDDAGTDHDLTDLGATESYVDTTSGTLQTQIDAKADYLFGANTFSGTGDIHCNDIYTSSATVHVGDGEIKSTAGNVELHHDGGKTLETTSSGIEVTGGIQCTGQVTSAGDVYIAGGTTHVGDGQITSVDGNIELYDNGNKKFETTSSGVAVTGGMNLSNVPSGATQGAAGVGAGELWQTTAGHTLGVAGILMIGQ